LVTSPKDRHCWELEPPLESPQRPGSGFGQREDVALGYKRFIYAQVSLFSITLSYLSGKRTVSFNISRNLRLQLPKQFCATICVIRVVFPLPSHFLGFYIVNTLRVVAIKLLQLPFQIMQLALQVQQVSGAQALKFAIDGSVLVLRNELCEGGVAFEACGSGGGTGRCQLNVFYIVATAEQHQSTFRTLWWSYMLPFPLSC
jgi:hypothetical protein